MVKSKKIKKTAKILKNSKYQTIAAIVVIVAAAILGYFLFIASHASTPFVSIEAESGTLDSGNIATKITDSTASGGTAVQFGALPSTGCGSNCGTGKLLLGLWSNGSVSASSLGVTQQILTDFASPGGGCGTFTSYSVPSTPYQIMLVVGKLTSSQASSIGNALVSSGHANTIFRVMPEQNNNLSCFYQAFNELTYPNPADYVNEFRTVVTELRAVPNNKFTFVWNPNSGEGNNQTGEHTYDTWPGQSYVNYVGVDVYDFGGYQTGTQEILDFANGHPQAGWPQLNPTLPVAFPEWGLNGSDDTTYMNYMIGVMKNPANNVAIQSYFSCGPSQGCTNPNSDLNQFSNSKAAYIAAFK